MGGVSPGPPRANEVDQSKPRPASALQTRLSPSFSGFLFSPGPLGSAHFTSFRPLTLHEKAPLVPEDPEMNERRKSPVPGHPLDTVQSLP